ncbi:hypothetical protein LguiA_002840 [Lonicera macranthoides]
MYDLLYTKSKVIHTRNFGLLRLATLSSTFLALIGFLVVVDWHKYSAFNVIITIVLLGGAICLEMYALVLLVSSDWMMLWFCKNSNYFAKFVYGITSCFSCITSKRKWSNSMGQSNLIGSCLEKHNKPIKCCKFLKEMLESYRRQSSENVSLENVSPYLKEFIFEHLLDKAVNTELKSCKQWCAARGDKVLLKNECEEQLWSVEVEFDHSILLWHIATNLCYFSDYPKGKSSVKDKNCEAAKMLSDYLVYILVKLPYMLPNGIGQIRFRDTCAEAMDFFKERKNLSEEHIACTKLLQVELKIKPSEVKGDRSKSLLFEACQLAKSLQSLESKEDWNKEKKWKMVCNVWVEMLSYAASRCVWIHHAEEMRNGGELITHIWLLMSHLGLTEQFQISQGHARIKLIVQEEDEEEEKEENEKEKEEEEDGERWRCIHH